MNNTPLLALLQSEFPTLPADLTQKVDLFRDILCEENKKQNLTRIISPQDFLDGHLQDCVELLKYKILEYPALDLGSGGGIPGIICGILDNHEWILTESEGNKANFLKSAVELLALSKIQVFSGRAEKFLSQSNKIGSVVVRAVGPISRIYSWIRNCSTWNNIVLLKGPGWREEWKKFKKTSHRNELQILDQHEYSVGLDKKQRVIVRLGRVVSSVPRGTSGQ